MADSTLIIFSLPTGSKGQAGPLKVRPSSCTGDENGHLCSYQFTAVDVCEPLALEIVHDVISLDLEYAVVFNAAHKINVEFPHYALTEKRTTLVRGKGITQYIFMENRH